MKLYHGSTERLEVGDYIDPVFARSVCNTIFATPDFGIAMDFALQYDGFEILKKRGEIFERYQYVLFGNPSGYIYVLNSESFKPCEKNVLKSSEKVMIQERIELSTNELLKHADIWKPKKSIPSAKESIIKASDAFVTMGAITNDIAEIYWNRTLKKYAYRVKRMR